MNRVAARSSRHRALGLQIVAVTLFVAALAIGVVIFRALATATSGAPQPIAFDVATVDSAIAAKHLSDSVQFPTVSFDDRIDSVALESLRSWLHATYPRFHAVAERTIVGDGTLMYEWTGTDRSLAPIILMAHQDVVPVPEPERWAHPPFSGAIVDGEVWGRGALDDKSSLVAIVEAAESLAATGYTPERTIFFVFGHDEESAGSGARAAAEALAEREVRAAFVLDEGAVSLTKNPVTGGPVTLIGIAEKGYLTLQLAVSGAGGHSNSPPALTAVDTLAQALVAIRDRPFPVRYEGVTKAMLEAMAPQAPFMTRVAIANSWLFDGLLVAQLTQNPATAATLQTTIAPTMLQASPKQNVLPSIATATINFRLLPGESIDGVVEHVQRALGDLPVVVSPIGPSSEPSSVSSMHSEGYRLIAGVSTALWRAPVAPLLTIGLTDSRAMKAVAEDIYRFSPIQLSLEDLVAVHGIDEKISVERFARMIAFYQQIIVGGGASRLP